MKPIGGYFELALNRGSNSYHETPYQLKSGRAALHCILNTVKPTLVYIPYYTCDALLEPFTAANVTYAFYAIDERLEPQSLPDLKDGEYFLYVNYFDLKRETVQVLSERYKDRLIVDCTQAFYMKGNGVSWYFNSCRKFFGVPDGSYLYAPQDVAVQQPQHRNEHYMTDHLLQRFNGHAAEGYATFLKNEQLAGSEVLAMSKLSEYLLSGTDYTATAAARRDNFRFLHDQLGGNNLMDAALPTDSVPMCYPWLTNRSIDKASLYGQEIFIPSFWKDTLLRNTNGYDLEKMLTDKLWPLPVDHRYTLADMALMCDAIAKL